MRREMVENMVVDVAGWLHLCVEIGLQSWGLEEGGDGQTRDSVFLLEESGRIICWMMYCG